MHPHLSQQLARSRQDDLLRDAEATRPSRSTSRTVRRVLLVTALILLVGGAARAEAAFVQQAKVTAADAKSGDFLGLRLAASRDTMVVASLPRVVKPTADPGAVYVFEKPVSGWADASKVATLKLPAGGGAPWSVAISGDTIFVGAIDATVGAAANQGAVYVFVKPPGGWQDAQPTAVLTASDGAAEDNLGFEVAASGDTIVSSALQHKVGANAKQGAAYVFVKPASGWANAHETGELTASDGAANDLLRSVAIDGDTIVAGAQAHKVGDNCSQGEAYVFVKPTAGWKNSPETARLTTARGDKEDFLGATVGVSGDTVIAGVPDRTPAGRPMHSGAVEVFVKPASGWATATETAELTASDGGINDELGDAAAISGDTVVAGAPDHNVGQNASQGGAYVFTRRPGSGWTNSNEDQALAQADPANGDRFGRSMALSGNVALIAAPSKDAGDTSRAGAAYVFGVAPSITIALPGDGAVLTRGDRVAASYSCIAPTGAAITSCAATIGFGGAIDTSAVGRHTFTVTAVDSDGIAATRGTSYTVIRPKAPSITALKQSHARWRERGKRPVGTTFSFRLDQPARVVLRFTRRGTRTGSLTRSAHAGLNRIAFAGRLSRIRKLAPGGYTMRITATNATGQSVTSRTLRFSIVR
jgi:hypothetical protein